MTKIKDIINYLEEFAPPAYQEGYDNSGLITGNSSAEVTGALISLDATEAVIQEAIDQKCNLVIAHHPIVFKGLKKITGKNYVERTIILAIKHDIAIYAIHTNLDNVARGVNYKISQKIGLLNPQILLKKSNTLSKLVTFAPRKDTNNVLAALHQAGAGNIGNYKNCSFRVEGTGTFMPNDLANPHIGAAHQQEEVNEDRIEAIFPSHLQNRVIAALQQAHPYEEVAYYINKLDNANQEVGSGMIGELPNEMPAKAFLFHLKEKMGLSCIRHTQLLEKPVKKIAVCGGAGSFLLPAAIRNNADVFITADYKYHEFFDADGQIIIADIGHYESEVYTKDLIYEILREKFTSFVLTLATSVTNPISYLY